MPSSRRLRPTALAGAAAVLLSAWVAPATAQNPSDTTKTKPDTAAAPKRDDGRLKITPLLAPAYNPEMGFLIAGGFLVSFRTERADTTLPRSSLSATISYGSVGAVNVSSRFSSYWRSDRLRLLLDFGLKDMRDDYWGTGYDAGLEPSSPDSTTKYDRLWWKFSPQVLVAVKRKLYVGGILDLNSTGTTDPSPEMAADSAYQATGPDNRQSGLGLLVQYDTRDVPNNAWRGIYLGLTTQYYGHFLGGENKYQVHTLDYRHYLSLGRNGRTLAWQVKSRLAYGTVPWPELSFIGSGYDLRGYREGRYRDNLAVFGLVEYRHTFLRSSGALSRHGFVTWAGGGSLGTNRTVFHGFLPNVGVGYRFELQPRANVRVDFGLGKKSNGVYFNFQEAF
jgi:outer membrane protein assembly factor BamA